MQVRGSIHSPDRAKQLRDFSGLRFGTITPTDIDGLIEYKNIGYILIELKYMDNVLPNGQRLALERLTDDLDKAGKPTLCIIAQHETHNCEDFIDVGCSLVSEYRFNKQWHPNPNLDVKTFCQLFMDRKLKCDR